MPSAKELRDELRMLRKEHQKPISKMRMGDVSAEIERLRTAREETPAPAATPSGSLKKSKAAVETVKEAKASEFPTKPSGAYSKMSKKEEKATKKENKMKAKEETAPLKKKSSKMAKLMRMMEDMSSDSE